MPFFAFLQMMDPHDPYVPYRPYDTRWADAEAEARLKEQAETVRPLIKSDFMKRLGLPRIEELLEAEVDPDEFVAAELDFYDGSIRAADDEIRRILEKLDELGLEERTLVVFLSDHGEEFLDHGGHFHEENVYGEMINVPLILRWPGVVPAGLEVDDTVELLDLAPTVLELVGLEVPEVMQGDSLVPLLAGSEATRWSERPAISQWRKRTDQQGSDIVDADSIIFDGWKLVHNVDRSEGTAEFELYDHGADPLDQIDVSADNPDIVDRLSNQLDDWRSWAAEHKLPTDEEATEGLDAEELERLRSLGYV